MKQGLWGLACVLVLTQFIWPVTARAHVGAPYPVLLEEPAGPYLVSALADPDVGQGTFYTQITLTDGEAPPPGTTLTVWAEPQDEHRGAIQVLAERQQTRYGERFVAEVPFDAEGSWQVQLVLAGSAGQGEVSFAVQVTPSGIGWLATLACLVPFVILGGLWWRGTRRQRSGDQSDS